MQRKDVESQIDELENKLHMLFAESEAKTRAAKRELEFWRFMFAVTAVVLLAVVIALPALC